MAKYEYCWVVHIAQWTIMAQQKFSLDVIYVICMLLAWQLHLVYFALHKYQNGAQKISILFLLCTSGPTNPMELLGDAANV